VGNTLYSSDARQARAELQVVGGMLERSNVQSFAAYAHDRSIAQLTTWQIHQTPTRIERRRRTAGAKSIRDEQHQNATDIKE